MNFAEENKYNSEAQILSNYLVGTQVDKKSLELYSGISKTTNHSMNESDLKIWNFLMKHPGFISSIDGALAFTNPKSSVRKKIFFMFAILECRPELSAKFMSSNFTGFYWVKFIWYGVHAVFTTIFGLFLLQWIKRF